MEGLKLSELKANNIYWDVLSERNVLIRKLASHDKPQMGLIVKDGMYDDCQVFDGQLIEKNTLPVAQYPFGNPELHTLFPFGYPVPCKDPLSPPYTIS